MAVSEQPLHVWNDPAAVHGCAMLFLLSKILHCAWYSKDVLPLQDPWQCAFSQTLLSR